MKVKFNLKVFNDATLNNGDQFMGVCPKCKCDSFELVVASHCAENKIMCLACFDDINDAENDKRMKEFARAILWEFKHGEPSHPNDFYRENWELIDKFLINMGGR